ncbi:MAG: hypothetical protein OXT67_05450, partial [Zetaproteobacteria bacterium]|nr:hypothetical protein [Zetaproteobacteria bacterium]
MLLRNSFFILPMLAISSVSMGVSDDSWSIERRKQVVEDLCTLSVYLSAQAAQSDAATRTVDQLLT